MDQPVASPLIPTAQKMLGISNTSFLLCPCESYFHSSFDSPILLSSCSHGTYFFFFVDKTPQWRILDIHHRKQSLSLHSGMETGTQRATKGQTEQREHLWQAPQLQMVAQDAQYVATNKSGFKINTKLRRPPNTDTTHWYYTRWLRNDLFPEVQACKRTVNSDINVVTYRSNIWFGKELTLYLHYYTLISLIFFFFFTVWCVPIQTPARAFWGLLSSG